MTYTTDEYNTLVIGISQVLDKCIPPRLWERTIREFAKQFQLREHDFLSDVVFNLILIDERNETLGLAKAKSRQT